MNNNKNVSLRETLEQYFKNNLFFGVNYDKEFSSFISFLDSKYKLSNIYNYKEALSKNEECNSKYSQFSYDVENEDSEISTTMNICFVVKDSININEHNIGILFDEVTLGESDYPYGKTTLYMLDGSIENSKFNYNNDSYDQSNSFVRKLKKK